MTSISFLSFLSIFLSSYFPSKHRKNVPTMCFSTTSNDQRHLKNKKTRKKRKKEIRSSVETNLFQWRVRDLRLLAQAPDGSDNGGKPVGVTAADSAPALWRCSLGLCCDWRVSGPLQFSRHLSLSQSSLPHCCCCCSVCNLCPPNF